MCKVVGTWQLDSHDRTLHITVKDLISLDISGLITHKQEFG